MARGVGIDIPRKSLLPVGKPVFPWPCQISMCKFGFGRKSMWL